MSLILLTAFLLVSFLEAATLWLLGVFDRPKFAWYSSYLAKLPEDDDEIIADDSEDEPTSDDMDHQRHSGEDHPLSTQKVNQVYLLVAVCKSKHVSSKLVCPMLSRTRRIMAKSLRKTVTASSWSSSAATLQDLMSGGAAVYGVSSDSQSVAVGLYFMDQQPSKTPSSASNCRGNGLQLKEWGCGWLLGCTTNLTQLQVMMKAASETMTQDFVPARPNDLASLCLDITAYSIQVPGPVVKGRIAWRSVFSPHVARWLHWRRAQALYDSELEQGGAIPGPSSQATNHVSNNVVDDSDATPGRKCVRCEIYMLGRDSVPQCIDYILVAGDRVRVVATADNPLKAKLA